jgi:restriction system protein
MPTEKIQMAKNVPNFNELMNPLLKAMRALGGSGSIEEIYDKVVELERFPDDVVAQQHDPKKSNQTEVGYRLAWARTFLKKFGLLENSSRGIWALTAKAKEVGELNPQDVVRSVRALDKKDEARNTLPPVIVFFIGWVLGASNSPCPQPFSRGERLSHSEAPRAVVSLRA